MLQKVEITDGGDTTFLAGEQIDAQEMREENAKLTSKQKPAEGKPVLLGITKASLQTRSFISAARSEEHTSELQSLMRISYAVFCLKKKKQTYHPKYDTKQLMTY